MLVLALFLQAALVPPRSRADSIKLRAEVSAREAEYVGEWRKVRETAHLLAGRPWWGGCDYAKRFQSDVEQYLPEARLVRNEYDVRASLCPRWSALSFNPALGDESIRYDGLLTASGQSAVRKARVSLIAFVDSASRALPGDDWLAGERVRLRVEQDDGTAVDAARTCRATAWWCAALVGYAEHVAGNTLNAEAAFAVALEEMPEVTRCEWTNLSILLNIGQRRQYDELTCAGRELVNSQIWWLADPLFLTAGNERRTEHYARHVLARLRLDNPQREPLEQPTAPGEAVAFTEMVVRYGWPTLVATTDTQPLSSSGCPLARKGAPPPPPPMKTRAERGALNSSSRAPYSKACMYVPGGQWKRSYVEYRMPGFHVVPTLQVADAPLSASPSSWSLGPSRAELRPGSSWWAPEFMQRREGPLVPLDVQLGFFRRDTTALIIAAGEWAAESPPYRQAARSVFGLVISTAPEERIAGARTVIRAGQRETLISAIQSRPALIGVELIGVDTSGVPAGPAARARLGVTPPPVLEREPGRVEISDIVLLRSSESDDPPTLLSDIQTRVLGSTRLINPGRIAIAWEAYGLDVGDSVTYTLRIKRYDGANALDRLLTFGILASPVDNLGVSWTERTIDPVREPSAKSSIRMRSIGLDVSALTAGDYAMEVSVARNGIQSTSHRDFSISRR